MFGNKKRQIQKLSEDGGVEAWGTVLSSQELSRSGGSTGPNPYQPQDDTFHQKVTVKVEPEGEPAFEVTFKQAFPDLVFPNSAVKVIYDPNDHSKIAVLDGQVFRWGRPGEEHQQVVFKIDGEGVSIDGKQVLDPGSLSGQVRQGLERIGAAPAAADPVDQLSKLADLHDRGALTDEEFAAEKAKLLGN